MLAKYGYETRNQSCTITLLLALIKDGKLALDKNLVLQFDTIEVDKKAAQTTTREQREVATHSIRTSIDTKELERVVELLKEVQKATIEILAN